MKNIKCLITGILILMAAAMLPVSARADELCNPNNIDTHYKGIYCGIRLYDNDEADKEIVKILSDQFSMDEKLIKEILANTICETVTKYDEDDKTDLPLSIQDACLPSGKSTTQVLGNWNVLADIRNAYNKEKIIQFSSKSLKFKFKTSEQYWNGNLTDAPFDLIVDLNLIETVLFGSRAQWMNDVFTFPKKEEAKKAPAETPADQLLPEKGKPAKAESLEKTTEPGITVTEQEAGKLTPECVPPDNPEADISQNPLCGNGTIDILMAEQCDDGNTKSGDGCNQYCQTEAGGSSDQCTDPEAVTFKKPGDGAGIGITDGAGEIQCPPGMVPKKGAGLMGKEAGPPKGVPQNPEYPGPYLGGTLKQFPESVRPPCGPGESPLQITVGGETHIAKDSEGNVRCIRTELCADFRKVREFLFGKDWEDDKQLVNVAPAIESLFCVNITKADRPESPYQMIEGCVDCHITAMTDALEKALETNVTPLQNTTSAFGISSRYGPAFSFNLNTAVKAKPKFKSSNTAKNAIKDANEKSDKSKKDNTDRKPAIKTKESPLQEIARTAAKIEESRKNILEDTRTFKMSNEVISDQEVGGRIIPLLNQMRDSFANIQSKYEGMVSSTGLDEKKQCPK